MVSHKKQFSTVHHQRRKLPLSQALDTRILCALKRALRKHRSTIRLMKDHNRRPTNQSIISISVCREEFLGKYGTFSVWPANQSIISISVCRGEFLGKYGIYGVGKSHTGQEIHDLGGRVWGLYNHNPQTPQTQSCWVDGWLGGVMTVSQESSFPRPPTPPSTL